MLCFLFSALIVALDQFFKRWVIRALELGETGPEIIPGVLGLTRWENDGAMLNILSGQQWLLSIIAFIAAVVLVMILLRYNEGFWGTLGLASVLGGTVGNLCDRLFNDGRVIDMFRTIFIRFPIFNIADIFITLGFITFLVHFIALTFKKEGDSKLASSRRIDTSNEEDTTSDTSGGEVFADIEAIVTAHAEQEDISYAKPQAAPITARPEPVSYYEPSAAAPVYEPAAAAPALDYTQPAPDSYEAAVEAEAETDVSYTVDGLDFDLEAALTADYDIDELLREYGIENDDINV